MADRSGRRAAAFWARRDVRGRWRSLILLGVLVGVTVGLSLSALAGARRTDSALARLRARTHAADAIVFPSQVGVIRPNWARLAARPEVAKLAVWDLLFGNIGGQPGGLLFGSADGTYLGAVDRPVVIEGRMFNPRAADEVVVDENAAKQAPPVGGSFTFQPYAPDQLDTMGAPRGPKVTMHVVGVVREVPEFLFVSDGQVLVSPGFAARYGSRMLVAPNADVVLRNGARGIDALRRDVNALIGPGVPVLDVHDTSRRVDTTLAVERTALLILAAAVALSGGILVAQALSRSALIIADDALALRAVGMTRDDIGVASAMAHVISVVVAAGTAFGLAVVASARFPIGLGRRVDPDVGYHVDWTVIGPGLALTVIGVLGAVLLIGRRAEGRGGRTSATRRSSLLGMVRRRAPLSVGLGTSMAFEAGRGRRRVPVVPALLAAVVAVLGVVATLTIDRGITNALDHPELAGVTFDLGVSPDPSAQTGRNVDATLARRITGHAGPGSETAVIDRDVLNVGGVGVPTFSVRPMRGESSTKISFTLTSGRPPNRIGEAAIGPATAKDLHVGIGDTITVGDARTRVQIVGEALFPADVHAEFDEGLWLASSQFDAVVQPMPPDGSASDGRLVAVRFAPGTNGHDAALRMGRGLGDLAQDVSPSDQPDELVNLRNIRALPDVLAGFLGLMAVAALSYALVSGAQRRRRDFAVLRAMGMSRWSSRLILNSQGTAIGLFGLVLGIPLGLAVGRSGWRVIAEHVPLADVAPLAVLAVVLIIPATIVVANALALWPGRLVTGSRLPANELRAE